jgi:hypothetical protein
LPLFFSQKRPRLSSGAQLKAIDTSPRSRPSVLGASAPKKGAAATAYTFGGGRGLWIDFLIGFCVLLRVIGDLGLSLVGFRLALAGLVLRLVSVWIGCGVLLGPKQGRQRGKTKRGQAGRQRAPVVPH